jgi:hypothetical protein
MIRAIQSSDDSRWMYFRDQVASVIFLGTTHRGSEWANRLHFLLPFAGPESGFVPMLRKGNSRLLATIAEQFNNYWGPKPILTIREGKGIRILGRVRRPSEDFAN